jgi:hypothetical protein
LAAAKGLETKLLMRERREHNDSAGENNWNAGGLGSSFANFETG